MKNINFAQKVTIDIPPRNQERGAITEAQRLNQIKINDPLTKVNIDRSLFSKTKEEKQTLRETKKDWRQSINAKQWLAQHGKPNLKKEYSLN